MRCCLAVTGMIEIDVPSGLLNTTLLKWEIKFPDTQDTNYKLHDCF